MKDRSVPIAKMNRPAVYAAMREEFVKHEFEVSVVAYLDADGEVIKVESHTDLNESSVKMPFPFLIIAKADKLKATSVVHGHSHVFDISSPSGADIGASVQFVMRLGRLLVADILIFSNFFGEDEWFSWQESGLMQFTQITKDIAAKFPGATTGVPKLKESLRELRSKFQS